MNEVFRESFGGVEDPRIERSKKHDLLDIIALGIMGIMAGAQGFEEIEDFGNSHKRWLQNYLVLENGIPSHDTINRVFQSLDPQGFQRSFLNWVNKIKKLFPETVVPIDGKTLRRSHQPSKGLKGLHVISAWSCANGLSLGQTQVNGKSNEITAIPELLNQLMLEGAIVTMDAMGCQKEIARSLVETHKADYVLAVKGNQGTLSESIRDSFKLKMEGEPVYAATDETEASHGRIETRHLEVLDAHVLTGLLNLSDWKSLKSIAKITCTTESRGKKTSEERFYISSLPPQDPQKILQAIRAHWSIESLHWSLDVTFREDDCRIRDETAALNFAWMRKMALSFLKADDSFKASIRRKQLKLWSCPDYFLKIFPLI